jgi:peptide methionine sulfoxide reductase MsrB
MIFNMAVSDMPKEIRKNGIIVKATGKRFCINSCALEFKGKKRNDE